MQKLERLRQLYWFDGCHIIYFIKLVEDGDITPDQFKYITGMKYIDNKKMGATKR